MGNVSPFTQLRSRRIGRAESVILLVAMASAWWAATSRADFGDAQSSPTPSTLADVRTYKDRLWLSADGEPTENEFGPAEPLTSGVFAEIDTHDSQLQIGPGEFLPFLPQYGPSPDEYVPVEGLPADGRLRFTIIAHQNPTDPVLVAVRVDAIDTTSGAKAERVQRWGPFEHGYCTGGGMMGFTTARNLDGHFGDTASLQQYDMTPVEGVYDNDDLPGDDTVVIRNRSGDGCASMSRGYDRNGRVRSAIVWEWGSSWSDAVPEGTPPPEITERAAQVRECLNGKRPVVNGSCLGDAP